MLRFSRRLKFKLPSVDELLDRTAPAHLRGLHLVEKEQQLQKDKEEAATKAAAAAKKVDPLKNKVAKHSSAGERGFVRGGSFGRNKPQAVGLPDRSKPSESKYEVQWSDEGGGDSGLKQQQPETLGDKIGSNLSRSRWQQAAEDKEREVQEEADVLGGLSGGKDGDAGAGGGGVPEGKGADKKKKGPGLMRRFISTFSLGREDPSAVRSEEQIEGGAASPYEDLDQGKLQTGKYFRKLHGASLKSWTKQCFQRLEDVSDLTLLSVDVETNPETDIVTVFLCADGGLDDKRVAEVKKWVEAICPVTKARGKLIEQMEEQDRKHSAHVLAQKSKATLRVDPLRQFAKRKNIRWIRIDPGDRP